MASAGNWCLMESDPGVFTELINKFGCEGVEVEEIYDLDDSSFVELRPVHGLIFLFKMRSNEVPDGTVVVDQRLQKMFFASQVIQNACATQAIVNLLMNLQHSDVTLGPILSNFKSFTQSFDPNDKGLSLSNSDEIRSVHNSFSRQQVFEMDIKMPEKEDIYHFVTYMAIDGRVYELDGLQQGPIDLGKIEDGVDWLTVVRPIIQSRIQRYSAGEIHFNLMALISDRKKKYEKRVEDLSEGDPADPAVASEIYRLSEMIDDIDKKRLKNRQENVRRRHNYIPFIIELLKILAEEKKLVPLVKEAKEKAKIKKDAADSKKKEVKSKA